MKEFNKLCKEFEEMDATTYSVIITEKSKEIIPALCAVTEDGEEGLSLFATFIVGAVVADGVLSVEEFALTFPLFKAFFGDGLSYRDCDEVVRKMRGERRQLKRYVNDMVDIFGQLSEELKNDIVLVCLMICAVDGRVSFREKRWIKKLLK